MTPVPFALPKILRFEMNSGDIEYAVCNSRTKCAIARNLHRELAIDVGRVRVSTAGVSIAKDGWRYYYKVPRKACKLVADFDAGQPVEPIVYQLRRTNRTRIVGVPPDQKARTNANRQERVKVLADLDQKPKTYPKGRYGI